MCPEGTGCRYMTCPGNHPSCLIKRVIPSISHNPLTCGLNDLVNQACAVQSSLVRASKDRNTLCRLSSPYWAGSTRARNGSSISAAGGIQPCSWLYVASSQTNAGTIGDMLDASVKFKSEGTYGYPPIVKVNIDCWRYFYTNLWDQLQDDTVHSLESLC